LNAPLREIYRQHPKVSHGGAQRFTMSATPAADRRARATCPNRSIRPETAGLGKSAALQSVLPARSPWLAASVPARFRHPPKAPKCSVPPPTQRAELRRVAAASAFARVSASRCRPAERLAHADTTAFRRPAQRAERRRLAIARFSSSLTLLLTRPAPPGHRGGGIRRWHQGRAGPAAWIPVRSIARRISQTAAPGRSRRDEPQCRAAGRGSGEWGCCIARRQSGAPCCRRQR